MSETLMPGVLVASDAIDAHYNGEDAPEFVLHPETGEAIASVGWHSIDAWRGYFEAEPLPGWNKVGEGCNCGDWDDTPPGTSNSECEAQIRELADEYDEVIVVLCGGSNVFAMQYDVLARAET
jgi:hypothetical protein